MNEIEDEIKELQEKMHITYRQYRASANETLKLSNDWRMALLKFEEACDYLEIKLLSEEFGPDPRAAQGGGVGGDQ